MNNDERERLSAEMTKENIIFEKEEFGKETSERREEVVEIWMWTALMLLDKLGYSITKKK